MNPSGRNILGALAAFILWSLVRAFRRGIINSTTGYSFTLDDSPMLFMLTAIAHAGGALFFVYLSYISQRATRRLDLPGGLVGSNIEVARARLIARRSPILEKGTDQPGRSGDGGHP